MTETKRIYGLRDLIEHDAENAPSLDISGLVVEKYYTPRDGGKYILFLANVQKNDDLKYCPYCRGMTKMNYSGVLDPQIIHDVVRNNCRVDIAIQPRRAVCTMCNNRITLPKPGVNDNHSMTDRLVEFLEIESFLQPHTVLADRSGVTSQTIANIMKRKIAEYDEERRLNPLRAPRVLGIDEKHLQNDMRGTLVNVEDGELLDILEDNRPQTMQDAIKRLKGWDTNIEVVTTDMNNAYLKWLTALLPNATVVIDKFHVIQDIEQRLTKTKNELYEFRKKLILEYPDGEERIRQQQVLDLVRTNKRLFNYSTESIVRDINGDKAQKLATIIDEFPEFRLLRKLYMLIENMYMQSTYEDAETVWEEWVALLPPDGKKKYEEWCDLYSVTPPMFDAFRSFSRQGFQFFKPYILNYFKPGCRFTNATTEGLNKMIDNINAPSNGLSFPILRAKCLYASLVHERIHYGINVKTIKKWKPTMGMLIPGSGGYREEITYEKIPYFASKRERVGLEPLSVINNLDDYIHIFIAPDIQQSRNILIVDEQELSNAVKYSFEDFDYDYGI